MEGAQQEKMTRTLFFTLIILVSSCGNPNDGKVDNNRELVPYPDKQEQENWELTQNAEPFAVVELFSSEGCSDCPEAEEVLNKLTIEAMADKSYIYPLAFHVDYWNKLGWKDPFADSAFSNRQRKYRKVLGNEVVYTPQMIINGRVEFTGTDDKRMRAVIDSVMKLVPECYFTIYPNENKLKQGILEFEYEILKIPANEESRELNICYALVERKLGSDIMRGENKGKKMIHQNVVRKFGSSPLSSEKGKCSMDIAGISISKNHSLIVFIQDAERMKIIGANLWNF